MTFSSSPKYDSLNKKMEYFIVKSEQPRCFSDEVL